MKYLLLAIVFSGTAAIVHPLFPQTEKRQEITAEQRAEIKSKTLGLELDLSETQISQLKAAILKNMKEREALMKEIRKEGQGGISETDPGREGAFRKQRPTPELKIKMLDLQLAHQKTVKQLLNEEQYREWRAIQKQRKQRHPHRKGHEHREHGRK